MKLSFAGANYSMNSGQNGRPYQIRIIRLLDRQHAYKIDNCQALTQRLSLGEVHEQWNQIRELNSVSGHDNAPNVHCAVQCFGILYLKNICPMPIYFGLAGQLHLVYIAFKCFKSKLNK